MTDSETVDVHIDPYDYTNEFEWTFGYYVMSPLLHNTLQNPGCIGILLSDAHDHYTVDP